MGGSLWSIALESYSHPYMDSLLVRRKTIALLTAGAVDPNNRAIWSGVAAACRDHGVNLICYPGRFIKSPVEFETQRNVIYHMIDSQWIDGMVMMGGLNAWIDPQETQAFLDRFRPMPIVTTGIIIDGIPGVSVDNYHGMHAVVTHLVSDHQRRRVAFIRGQANHQEAIDRYQAYLDVLAENKIPFDPDLIYQGNFKESGGVEAVQELLDVRRVSFDALAAASDNMAIGALKTLQARGVRIPQEVAIAGVNDEDQDLVIAPALTTAPLHFFEQAYQAALMVFEMLDGREVPSKIILPTRLLMRQSCGCPDPLIAHARATPHTERLDSFTEEIRLLEHLVFGDQAEQIKIQPKETVQREFPHLLKLFLAECEGKIEGKFVISFSETIKNSALSNDAYPRWHEIISMLRQFAISQLTDAATRLRIENLTQQARVIIGESARRNYAYQVIQMDEKMHILGEISQALSVTTSKAELIDVLERSLKLMDISRCYLFLYEKPVAPDGLARFVFAYDNHQRLALDPEGMEVPTHTLLPPNLLAAGPQRSLVVEPIFFREDQLGYAIFEGEPEKDAIFEILGGQISASLKRTILTERNVRLYDEALEARQSAEQANLLKSRFLSMVSHELRTPLALIVGTIEMMLQEEKSSRNPPLPDLYRQDMEGIYTSSKHLSRLIADVLDLASSQAGELRLNCEALDLSELIAEAAVLGKSLAREKNLQWRQELPDHLPLVWGDRTRLRQVTINLLSNAVKFTEQGYVSLKVSSSGGRLMVEVGDTGLGIPVEEQKVIFDEFRRSERSVARGYGGMGLGLAITRRLIELHGGEIGVRSTGVDGTGSTFYFSLPVIQPDPSVVETCRRRKNLVLLLVDGVSPSHPLRQHLLDKGFEVEVMAVAQQGDWLNQVIARGPEAIVLDFQPATEVGWELMRRIKQNPLIRDVPVVFYNLSADSATGSMLELDYLTKPVGSADLSRALERLGLKDQDNPQAILVVDDDPNVLEMHARMLESQIEGRILKANNGKTALELMRKENLALVLLDLMMPEMDGFEVLRLMREQEATRCVPVIILTAQILTPYDMQRLRDGVAVVLGKGLFSADEVLAQVEAALNHSKRLGSQTSQTVRAAMAYIHAHYNQPITRAELARSVALTERYLTHCFREELGITPIEYLNRYRISRAKVLLEQGALSITDVAMAAGFSDSSYFSRVFRQETGVSPRVYQQGEKNHGI